MKLKKHTVINFITAIIIICTIIVVSIPVNAASEMRGLDFSMKEKKSFIINCYTPAGMKPKKVTLKWCEVTNIDISDYCVDNNMLDYYDDYYDLNKIVDFEESELEWEKKTKKYYKKMLSKLEEVRICYKCNRRWSPDSTEVDKCCDTKEFYDGDFYLVDYKSGKSLIDCDVEPTSLGKKKGIYCNFFDIDLGDVTYFGNGYGEEIWLRDSYVKYITIIKPKKYKDMCFGVTGFSQLKDSSNDKKFNSGKISFKKTSSYSKYPNNSKWMKIN